MFTCFAQLPTELQRKCIRYCDARTHKSLRYVSKFVSELATEEVYRIAYLRPVSSFQPEIESWENFLNILEHHEFSRYVRKVFIDTSEEPWAKPISDGSLSRGPQSLNDDQRTEWAECIRRIGQFPNLTELELRFALKCGEGMFGPHDEGFRFRVDILEMLFEVLNKEATKVDTLTLSNLEADTPVEFYENEDFLAVRSRITRLHLQIAVEEHDYVPEESINFPARHIFFGTTFRKYWLDPMKDQLTHLSMYCNDYWGFCPFFDTHGLHFPNLRSLALGHWSIAYDHQIDWIVSHGGTLEELVLSDCSIVHAARMDLDLVDRMWPEGVGSNLGGGINHLNALFPSLRWDQILPVFRCQLPHLRVFRMGTELWDHGEAFENRYELPTRLDTSRYCLFDSASFASSNHWIIYALDGNEECNDTGYGYVKTNWIDEMLDEHVEHLRYPDSEKEEESSLCELVNSLKY